MNFFLERFYEESTTDNVFGPQSMLRLFLQ